MSKKMIGTILLVTSSACCTLGIVGAKIAYAIERGMHKLTRSQDKWPGLKATVLGAATLAMIAVGSASAEACTGFYARAKGKVLVGNNEDSSNPNTKVWFVPGEAGTYGRMYVGFDDLSAQGGVNERGLWFDAFGLPRKEVASTEREIYAGDLQDKLMAECATVAEVLELLKRYSRSPMTRYQWMFGDRTGMSVIIEGDSTPRS